MTAKQKKADVSTETLVEVPFVEPAIEAPSLGIQDINNALKIIDFAAEQGAFKGWNTIQQVLSVREKIAAFVAYAQANADEPGPAPAEATA